MGAPKPVGYIIRDFIIKKMKKSLFNTILLALYTRYEKDNIKYLQIFIIKAKITNSAYAFLP